MTIWASRKGFGLVRNLALGLAGALLAACCSACLRLFPAPDKVAISLRDVPYSDRCSSSSCGRHSASSAGSALSPQARRGTQEGRWCVRPESGRGVGMTGRSSWEFSRNLLNQHARFSPQLGKTFREINAPCTSNAQQSKRSARLRETAALLHLARHSCAVPCKSL